MATVLLIEDESCKQDGLAEFLARAGYQCHSVVSIQQAADFIRTGGCLDLLMVSTPVNGSEQLASIRTEVAGYLPLVVVGERGQDDFIDDYLKIGVDGFVFRPLDQRLLRMSVESALRMGRLDRRVRQQRRQLADFSQQMDLEQEVAFKIYQNVLQSNYLHTGVIKSFMSPMALFNGDLLLAERTPDNNLYVLLGDFTGHGLSASVAAMPVADIFYGMARKGFALADLVQEINARLYRILPTNRFLAATAVALYPDSKSLSLITCGLPEHFLVNDLDGSHKVIPSKNIPLGIQRTLELGEQSFSVARHHHLYLMTDGVFDAPNSQGEAFGTERITAALCRRAASGFDSLRAMLDEHTADLKQQDDISFVKLICDVDDVPWQCAIAERLDRPTQALNWKTSMELEIDALRLLNPVPVLVDALMEIQGLQQYRQSIFLIISELFANALDHGLLKLDSAIKTSPEGFMRFYQMKEERLQGLQVGKICLLFSHKPTDKGGQLTIEVSDSGDGFNWQGFQHDLRDNLGFCGRGLKLLETLCSRVTFHGKGNRVTAVFDWLR